MALSNWDTLCFDENGKSTNGIWKSPLGVVVQIYKNWVYVRDEKAWVEGCEFSKPTVMEIHSGDFLYKDVNFFVLRGPQSGSYVVAYWQEFVDGKMIYQGIIGCGVYGFNEAGDFVGVEPSSVEWFKKQLNDEHVDVHVPDIFKNIDMSKGKRFNQGDMFFNEKIGTPLGATKPGKAGEPIMIKMLRKKP